MTMGRPPIVFDYDQIEKLAQLHCTDEDLADFFECSVSTIEKRKVSDPDFLRALKKGKGKGRISLRRMQYKAAQSGNTTMLIWLGKQLLGQTDKREVATGQSPNLEPVKVDYSGLVERLREMGKT